MGRMLSFWSSVFFILFIAACEKKPNYYPSESDLEKAAVKYFKGNLKPQSVKITFQEIGRDDTFTRIEYPIKFGTDYYKAERYKVMDHIVLNRKFKKGEILVLHGTVKSFSYAGEIRYGFQFENDSKLKGLHALESFDDKVVIHNSKQHLSLLSEERELKKRKQTND